jgi:hypothetical protein
MLTDADRAEFRELMRRALARLGSAQADAEQNANSLHLATLTINMHIEDLIRHIIVGAPLPAGFPSGALANILDALREFIAAHYADRFDIEDYAYDILLPELLFVPESMMPGYNNNGYNSYGGRRARRRTARRRATRRRTLRSRK